MIKPSLRGVRASLVIAVFVFAGLIGALIAQAQAPAPSPIKVGDNATGNFADAGGSAQYALAVSAPESVNILALSITPGFSATFSVADPSGVTIFDDANADAQTRVQATLSLSSVGTYIITVRGVNASAGQYALSVQPGAPLAPPQGLTLGTPVSGSLDAKTARQAYAFSGSPTDVLLLSVQSGDAASGPTVALRDADSNDALAITSARFAGTSFRIPAAAGNYLVEVTHGGSADTESFTVCLATESDSAACPSAPSAAVTEVVPAATEAEIVPTPTEEGLPTPTELTSTCALVSSGPTVNVRSGPSTFNGVVAQLAPGVSAPVLAKSTDGGWFEVNVNGVIGWVSASVVTTSGDCTSLPSLSAPVAAPPPTKVPPQPTSAPSNPPPAPTKTPKPTKTPTTVPSPTLNPTTFGKGHGPVIRATFASSTTGNDITSP